MPRHFMPENQAKAFQLALAEFLDVNPDWVAAGGFRLESLGNGDVKVSWEGVAVCSEARVLELLNAAGQEPERWL